MLNVKNADDADCNGRYELLPALRAPWAPDKPVFKRLHTEGRGHVRFIFWTAGKGHGNQWVLGGPNDLTKTGGYFHASKGKRHTIVIISGFVFFA